MFVLLIVLLSGCTAFQAVRLVNSGQVAPSNKINSTVPFLLAGHPMLIRAKLNNFPQDYTYIFDTGAEDIMIIRKGSLSGEARETKRGRYPLDRSCSGIIFRIHCCPKRFEVEV